VKIIDLLAREFNVDPKRLQHCLERCAAERGGTLVDSGGIRAVRRPGKVVIEKYLAIDCEIEELLK